MANRNRKIRIGYFLYNAFLILASLIIIPYFVIRNIILKRPVFPYFKGLPESEAKKLMEKPVIWIQAVSVGETVVANIIIGELRKQLPEYQIVLTTTTPTGQAMAKKLLGDDVLITYFPFDFPFFVKRFIKQVKPKIFLMTETEIWPNAIHYAKVFGSCVAIVNGFISDRSFKRYQRFKPFLKEIFENVDLFAMQSTEAANRIGMLGATLDRIKVTGNTKFDQNYPVYSSEQLTEFLVQYGWSREQKIFTAASTHKGEEEIVLDAYLKMTENEPYYLILAPRHPERAAEVMAILKEKKIDFVRRSETKTFESSESHKSIRDVSVLLLDTFGELGLAYAVADLVFVGGSLANIGGHNVLEAAVQAKPVIYGPYMHKARESKRLLEEVDAGFTVNDADELVRIVKYLTSDAELYQKRAQAARNAVLSNKGAASDTARLVAELVRK